MPGYFYAHVPSLGLTTHGLGVEGALEAARDLVTLWAEEKRAHGENLASPPEVILAMVEVANAAQSQGSAAQAAACRV